MSDFKIKLSDYALWYDGFIEVEPESVVDFIDHVGRLAVTSSCADITEFNRLNSHSIDVDHELNVELIDTSYNISDVDIETIAVTRMIELNLTSDEYQERLANELSEFRRVGQLDFVKAVYNVIDFFKKNSIVWGVGRGSSCASLLLFLLDVHKVDPVKWDIKLNEFIKDSPF